MKYKQYELLSLNANLYTLSGTDTTESAGSGKMLNSVNYRTYYKVFDTIQELLRYVFDNYCGGIDYNSVDMKYLPNELQRNYVDTEKENASTFITFSVIGKYNDDYSVHCEKPSDTELDEMKNGSRTLTCYDFGMCVRKVEYESIDDELSGLGLGRIEE